MKLLINILFILIAFFIIRTVHILISFSLYIPLKVSVSWSSFILLGWTSFIIVIFGSLLGAVLIFQWSVKKLYPSDSVKVYSILSISFF
jgi:hypothetical protein